MDISISLHCTEQSDNIILFGLIKVKVEACIQSLLTMHAYKDVPAAEPWEILTLAIYTRTPLRTVPT